MKAWRFTKVTAENQPVRYDLFYRHTDAPPLGHVIKVSDHLWQPYDSDGTAIGTPTYARDVAAKIIYLKAYDTYRADPANN